ncbi:hexokinase [Aspergillus ruber CBS 135680]|uniref:Phosphotransferase n=1 Tax=Aspergillus ruber (strain CBS 135680) TaxID=1388766 RepID=A0A017SH80_ASPRC|nr:hexokinase [Aspergillus ruber CBS 135680]EYE96333.1 hexokinase [Aspergillus ruber CBS 135680]
MNVEHIQGLFTVDTNNLQYITDHLVKELEKGLTSDDSDIPMNVTWVTRFPTGNETGRYLTVDIGGTNLRVCDVLLTEEKGGYKITQDKYMLSENLKTGTGSQLWDYIADCLQDFLQQRGLHQSSKELPLAFTFSYPVTQHNIRHGLLQRWTKGLNISGVEGKNVVAELENVLQRRNLPIRVVALVNDTTGTLIASAYKDGNTKVGSIFGTGCNAAYMEEKNCISKISPREFSTDMNVVINTEYGAFDNSHQTLPRTSFDEEIDRLSPRPGQQTYEKMVAGQYIGELVRLILCHLHQTVDFLSGLEVHRLQQRHSMESSCLSKMEEDESLPERIAKTRIVLKEVLGIEPPEWELWVCCRVAEIVCTRAARLYACGIAAICKKRGIKQCRVGVDGSAFSKYPRFQQRAATALREILEWPKDSEDPVQLCLAEDGSGVGAALIAALSSDGGTSVR